MALRLVQPRISPGIPPCQPDARPFNILQAYLEARLPLAQTVERLTAPIEKYYDDEDGDEELLSISLYFLWATFDALVNQIPHGHPGHMKLAELIIGIKSRGCTQGDAARMIDGEGLLWEDLPLWPPGDRSDWNSPTSQIRSMTSRPVDIQFNTLAERGGADGVRDRWIRSNAFMARLSNLPGASEFDLHGLLTMQYALENEADALDLSLNVPGAAMWIFYAGERMYQSDREWQPPYYDRFAMHLAKGSFYWNGKNGFCRERWQVWKLGFEEVTEMEQVYEETREFAAKAAQQMREIEASETVRTVEKFRKVVLV